MPNSPTTGNLMVNVFDGTRKFVSPNTEILLRVRDGNQKEIVSESRTGPNIPVTELPIYNNFGDNYAVLVSATGYKDAGFYPIKMVAGTWQSVDLMLLPSDGTFNFRDALWPTLKQTHPSFAALLAHGATDDNAAQDRYSQRMETKPKTLASFFNLVTAMSTIYLPKDTPLDYIKEVIWDDSFAQDRFFGWADAKIIEQVKLATDQKLFAPELDPGLFHKSATSSWKQIQFGEANVQLTFHEGETKQIDGINCVKIEPDIDYYKDLGAHALLEVVVNFASHTLTNPEEVYLLRWIAGRHAGVPEFNPPYVLA